MPENKMFHFPDFSIVDGNMRINIGFSRFSKQFQEAQFWLDSQVMADMEPLMPLRTGVFINITRMMSVSVAGTGKVYAAPPGKEFEQDKPRAMGRFLYMGKVMVDPVTLSPWAQPGAKKIVTDTPLRFSRPGAVPMWFDVAKARHGSQWVDGVKKRAGGGR